MIWYLIGWCVLGFIAGVLVGRYCGWVGKRLGYEPDEFNTTMLRLYVDREAESKRVDDNTSLMVPIALFIFNSIFWPVVVFRMIFLDIPNTIEWYKLQQNKEEQA